MKKILLAVLLSIPSFICWAKHSAGGDLCYTYISGNKYRVTLTIYGNCELTDNNYLSLFTGTPQVAVFDSVTKVTFKTMSLKIMSDSTLNISPYCTKYLDSTNCTNISYAYQGYTRFVYADTVTLPYQSSKWIFRFTSAMSNGCSSRLGRPANISNLVNGVNTNMALEAMLNNSLGNNSSPSFYSALFSAYCVNVPSSYSQLAHDPDNDSLFFQLVNPLSDMSSCGASVAVAYVTGFNPLKTSPNGFSFNNNDGTMFFTANSSQISAVATKVYEYRNGILVGYAMREKIFNVLSSCNNTPPLAAIDTAATSLQGAAWYHDSLIACPGNLIQFDIPVSNIHGDTIKASAANIPSGSNVTISNNNSKTPTIHFVWNTAGVAPGVYTFYGDYKQNGCPLKTEAIVAYTIVISDGGTVVPSIITSTHCLHKAAVQYNVQATLLPYTLTIQKGSATVKTLTGGNNGIVTDSLDLGDYIIKLNSTGIPCTTQVPFNVADSGQYPFTPTALSPIDYCRNADAQPLVVTADSGSIAGTVLAWYDDHFNFISGNPFTPATNTSGTFTYYVREKYKTCESLPDTVVVTISGTDCNYDITIHNAITPNGDGKNDRWIIDNLGYYPNMNVQVFDKLGDKVYEQTNYQNDWDGGNLPSGIYYYLIRLNGPNKTSGTEKYTGFLMIKR